MCQNEQSIKCAIIILNYFSADLTKSLCKSILAAQLDCEIQLYIVDNSCQIDERMSLQRFARGREKLKLIRQPQNLGYGAGNYVGIEQALNDGCSGVVICNPDIQFPSYSDFEEFMNRIKCRLSRKDEALIAAPNIYNPYTRYLENPIYEPKFFSEIFGLKKNKNILSFCGCFFFLNYRALQLLEIFPTDVFMYNEELIIGKKLNLKRSNILFFDDITIFHCHKRHFKSFKSEIRRKHHQITSRVYVYKSYFGGGYFSSVVLYILLWMRGFLTIFVKWVLTKGS